MLNWLKRPFRRSPPPDVAYEQKLQALLVADTPAEQAQLARDLSTLHHRAVGRAANEVQAGVWAMEGRLAETMRQEFGRTNTTIGDGIGGLREQMTLLQGTFSKRLDDHDHALQGLKKGQERIVTHVDTQIGGVVQQQTLQAEQIREISRLMEEQRTTYEARIAELEAYQSAISADERARRIAQIEDQEQRLRALEEKPPLS